MNTIQTCVFFIFMTAAAGLCKDQAWQATTDDPATPINQQCLCHHDNFTKTKLGWNRPQDLMSGANRSYLIGLPYLSSKGPWNTDCLVKFTLQSVSEIPDSSLRAQLTGPTRVIHSTTISDSDIPSTSLVSFFEHEEANVDRAFSVAYDVLDIDGPDSSFIIKFHVEVSNCYKDNSGTFEVVPRVFTDWKHYIRLGSFCCSQSLGVSYPGFEQAQAFTLTMGDPDRLVYGELTNPNLQFGDLTVT